MKKLLFLPLTFLFLFNINCSGDNNTGNKDLTGDELVARGKYLVTAGGCHDCHSPKTMSDKGPVPDESKILSGFPSGTTLPPIDTTIAGKTWYFASMDLTAWVGPWGISYAANLTPDQATGLGNWTEDVFINAMRTGKHMGVGRPILPPMPWFNFAEMKDEDLKAIFAYLKTLDPIRNQVPEPTPPNMVNKPKPVLKDTSKVSKG